MASAAEQLAANINWSAFGKAEELKKRIWFTLGALVIFRLGTYIPVPGVDASVMGEMLSQHGGGLLIPFARAICVEIDTQAKRILVNLPEGLKDLNRP